MSFLFPLAFCEPENLRESIQIILMHSRQISDDFDTVWPNPFHNAKVVWRQPDSKIDDITERVKAFNNAELNVLLERARQLENGVMLSAVIGEIRRRASFSGYNREESK